jgi:hypothetical protein
MVSKKNPGERNDTPRAELPNAWRSTARGLNRSAELIWERWLELWSKLDGGRPVQMVTREALDVIDLLPPYLLLSGLAFENLLKGLLVSKDPEIVRGKMNWNISKGGHDLKKLCDLANILVSAEDLSILEARTEAILWAGRYPVPKFHEGKSEFGIPIGLEQGAFKVGEMVSRFSRHKARCDDLLNRIDEMYP